MASGETIPVEPLQHKTIVLKTSIHCPGCSRKVKRIIQSIPGVYNFAIDPSQNKVSITGDVEADVIVKKFLKSNKQVELWPEKKPKPTTANTNTSTGKNQSKEINTSSDPSEKKKKPDERFEEKKPSDKSDATATDDLKTVDVAQEAAAEAPSKSDNGPEKSPNENDPKSQQGSAVANIDDSNKKSENQEAKSGGDSGNKKKEKMVQKEINSGNSGNKKKEKMVQKEINSGDRAVESSATEGMTSLPPLQQPQNLMYHAPTAAAYVMSYNMAQPSTAHSYYAFPPTPPSPPPPPPPSTQGYFYSPYPPQPPPPEFFYGQPSEWGSPAPPPESYHMFNDENANSCNVM